MTADDTMMKNKATDLSNLPVKVLLSQGCSPRYLAHTFVVSNEFDALDKQVWLVQLVLAE
jgi:hypothetical protein